MLKTLPDEVLPDLIEIAQINDRVAQELGENAKRTRQIVTLEDEVRKRYLERDMPTLMSSDASVAQAPTNKPLRAGLGMLGPPLAEQLLEEQHVRDLRQFYSRDLDSFVLRQSKYNEQLRRRCEQRRVEK